MRNIKNKNAREIAYPFWQLEERHGFQNKWQVNVWLIDCCKIESFKSDFWPSRSDWRSQNKFFYGRWKGLKALENSHSMAFKNPGIRFLRNPGSGFSKNPGIPLGPVAEWSLAWTWLVDVLKEKNALKKTEANLRQNRPNCAICVIFCKFRIIMQICQIWC